MTRDPQEILRELVSWRNTLDDVRTINTAAREGSERVAGATMALLELAMAGGSPSEIELISEALRRAMSSFEAMQAPLDGILGRGEERLAAMRAEINHGPAGDLLELYPSQLCACGCGLPASFGPYRGGHRERPCPPVGA